MTKLFFTDRIYKYTPLLILGIFLFLGIQYKLLHRDLSRTNTEKEVICSDGIWYYSYLPALFIYGDLTYSFLPEVYKANYKGEGFIPYPYTYKGKPVNKFFVGEAILLAPFFLTAHALSYMMGYTADGYSLLYQVFVWVAAVFYVVAASRFLYRLLLTFEISTQIASFCVMLAVFGTNLFYYVFYEPAFSHAYSFFAISGFLWYARRVMLFKKPSSVLLACFFLALIFLIRPVNILILAMLPFLAGNSENLKSACKWLVKQPLILLTGSGIILLMGFLQMLLWKLQTGSWLVWSYGDEKFNFAEPHMFDILFSYKKGLFIYTPLTFLSLAGLIYFFRNNKLMFYTAIFFILISAYVLSSWWSWWYAMSFGMRAFIEFFPVFFIFLAFLFKMLKSKTAKITLVAISLFLVYVNQVQAYQYRYFILHWEEMDREKYWRVFLRTDDKYRGMLWNSNVNIETPSTDNKQLIKQFDLTFENGAPGWQPGATASKPIQALSGKWFGVLDANHEFGPTLASPADTFAQSNILAEVSIQVYATDPKANGNLVISLEDNAGKVSFYKAVIFPDPASEIELNKWQPVKTVVKIENIKKGDILKAYVYNPRHTFFCVDNFSVKIFRP